VAALSFVAAHFTGAGRRFWFPYYLALAGGRSHADVLRSIGPVRREALRGAAAAIGAAYPPSRLTLVGLKDEAVLEAWVPASGRWKLVREYPVLAASGGPGPKLRAGDLQVPEGIYRLTAFNPNSSYHLSLRVDYPNADDVAAAKAERRENLGGDIFVHGKAVSIGCLALGDAGIEELYVLVADVGLPRTRLLLAPSARPVAPAGSPVWVTRLYERLAAELEEVRDGGLRSPQRAPRTSATVPGD
jgi:hypothetical protein